ncbi:hypothetical protein U2044_15330, partial [Listeria monocytogenes]
GDDTVAPRHIRKMDFEADKEKIMNAISPTNAGIARKHRGIWFWVKRGLLGLLLFLIALPLTGLAFNAVASENDRRNYPPPGQLVDIGGYS